tara:strand:+ start:1640 stop:2107 length:468 start_codon:yes stop_codon:yes gene_type:complete
MLLYLDLDGVMIPANSWSSPVILEDGFPEFNEVAVNSLNRIISFSGASIVLTTSRKHKFTSEQWRKIFKRRNIIVGDLSKLPQNTKHLSRREELVNWISEKNRDNNFLIIDDDKSLNDLPPSLKSKLIQTSASVGLTDYLAEEALRKISNNLLGE